MDDTPDTGSEPDKPQSARSRYRWTLIGAAVGALLVAGIIGAVVVLNNEDTPRDPATQIGWIGEGCQQWTADYRGSDGPNGEWCNSMASWMSDESVMGQGQMMGPVMWQNPSNMRATCERWLADMPDGAPEGADRSAWCEEMTVWMAQNMGGWDN